MKFKPKGNVFWVLVKPNGRAKTFVGQDEPVLYSTRRGAAEDQWTDDRIVKVRLLREGSGS